MRFKDKVVIVTGSSRGIGLSIANAFLAQGAKVVISGRKKSDCVRAVSHRNALIVPADVSKPADIKRLVSATVRKFGKIDVLVNNAGIYETKSLLKSSDSFWDDVVNTNLRGPFLLCRAVLPFMKKGSIVNVSSVLGAIGDVDSSVYCASKAGLIGLTRALAVELAPGIRVNAVGPGPINTRMLSNLSPVDRQKFLSYVPFGRFGEPDEIAGVVLFLASSDASYLSGQCLFVDGGMLSR